MRIRISNLLCSVCVLACALFSNDAAIAAKKPSIKVEDVLEQIQSALQSSDLQKALSVNGGYHLSQIKIDLTTQHVNSGGVGGTFIVVTASGAVTATDTRTFEIELQPKPAAHFLAATKSLQDEMVAAVNEAVAQATTFNTPYPVHDFTATIGFKVDYGFKGGFTIPILNVTIGGNASHDSVTDNSIAIKFLSNSAKPDEH